MDKTARLFSLMDALRRRRLPVTAATLADELSVSVRTIYRDVQALIALGATIDGEAGMGYVLRTGFFLPPLMFDDAELEALVLGASWVAGQGDEELVRAAHNVLAKVATASPRDLRDRIDGIGLWASPVEGDPGTVFLPRVREAIRLEQMLHMHYRRADGEASERTVWPIMLAFFERVRMLVAWCELRQGFRHFRLDRISELTVPGGHYPRRRSVLVREWRREMRIPE
ncbi:YafY family transcriptional regulator [Alcanivorax sp. JB21]|uniref:helix-turn-helix transcriptional regulator n=1 Tax=Alcanivorax limicola TaxID=2874102 RepID=UPI001CBB3EDF|nr:YafY family protein [Alcanivorax limicola]MBZ2188734.1 YafY family transcriptional regulator [Alcanivorax limicola]